MPQWSRLPGDGFQILQLQRVHVWNQAWRIRWAQASMCTRADHFHLFIRDRRPEAHPPQTQIRGYCSITPCLINSPGRAQGSIYLLDIPEAQIPIRRPDLEWNSISQMRAKMALWNPSGLGCHARYLHEKAAWLWHQSTGTFATSAHSRAGRMLTSGHPRGGRMVLDRSFVPRGWIELDVGIEHRNGMKGELSMSVHCGASHNISLTNGGTGFSRRSHTRSPETDCRSFVVMNLSEDQQWINSVN
ncbi:hypothetical protein DFH08DRAFT_1028728 [Mycena albidolilacea]|uniref:Uncharacterized protein n=1 Tax=Mycena albidolilacea TaxID=1033008 RepID=A0AAD7EIC5_9AGAR|nr:hypothetical protein DFH08DRAFT_1028728 [Mycena albidolilacea]